MNWILYPVGAMPARPSQFSTHPYDANVERVRVQNVTKRFEQLFFIWLVNGKYRRANVRLEPAVKMQIFLSRPVHYWKKRYALPKLTHPDRKTRFIKLPDPRMRILQFRICELAKANEKNLRHTDTLN